MSSSKKSSSRKTSSSPEKHKHSSVKYEKLHKSSKPGQITSHKASKQTKPEAAKQILNERCIQSVPYPATKRLTVDSVYDECDKLKLELIREHFFNEGRLTEDLALKIISRAKELLQREPNILKVAAPVVIVGDIHGQYYDLLTALGEDHDKNEYNYLFLGDYVDRGHFSIEVLLYLYSLKINFPNRFKLLRGNHECRHLTAHFTFKRECMIKYSSAVYYSSVSSFDCLPLAAVVNEHFFCVHGGISPQAPKLEDIQRINRFIETPQRGPLCDLMWADPHPDFEKNEHGDFVDNEIRGCSYYYAASNVSKFLKENNRMLSVIRAHEAQDQGFRVYYKPDDARKIEKENQGQDNERGHTRFPILITIFSAPNYLDAFNNKGAIIKYENNVLNAKLYPCVPHPYWLPNFMDVFTWSLPFIAEKVTEMLVAILNIIDDDCSDEMDRTEIIKKKLFTVNKLASMYHQVRVENEAFIKLNGITPSTVSPLNIIEQGLLNPTRSRKASLTESTVSMLETNKDGLSFSQAKELDKPNEQFPPINESLVVTNEPPSPLQSDTVKNSKRSFFKRR